MKNERPTLVILTPGFPTDEEDSTCLPGQQSLVRSINWYFPLVRVLMVSFQYPFRRMEYEWYDNQVMAFGGRNKGGFSRLLLWREIDKALLRVKKENNVIGLLSLWCGECALLGSRFGKKNGIPHYCWIMGQDAKKGNRYVKRIKPGGEELIAISDFIGEEFNRHHAIMPARVIPIGIDPAAFTGERVPRDIDILCAGSLIPLKRYERSIDAIAEVRKFFPTIRAVICGKGPEEVRLASLIKDAGLQDTISLRGEIPHPELLQLMRRTRILLHPSSYEGFSGSCLESLYAGAHVISFCRPMAREMKNWHIVNSFEGLAKKTISLLASPLPPEAILPYPMEETVKNILGLFSR